ncbi:MAG: general secretion pathway protein GspK [Phycisphaerae bacterium]|nr:general secretion pathway protein GspK [Phycisphaerae bacterium]
MTKKHYNNLISRGGSSLVMVLWIFVILTVITAVVAQTSRLDTRITATGGDRLRCKWACRAGMETAIGILTDDERESDSLGDLWADNPEDLENVELNGCTFSVEVIDEAGKLNINTLNQKKLMYLPDMTEEIANSILDWRDKDDDLKPGSAEEGYYQNIPYPYRIRNKGLRTIRELLRVKGVTEELFYGRQGEDTFAETADENVLVNEGWINYLTCYSREANKDPEGNKRLDINSASENRLVRNLEITQDQAKWIVDTRKNGFKTLGDLIGATSDSTNPKTLDLQTALGLIDKICVKDNNFIPGKININTASKVVLLTVFSGNEQVVNDIIAYRQSQLNGIESFEQLTEISSLKKNILKDTIDMISLRSGIYTIRSTATANLTDTIVQTETVVDRDLSPVQIIYFCQGAKL